MSKPSLNIQMDPRVEVDDLATFIAEKRGISWQDAGALIPGMYYEDCHFNIDDIDNGDWSKELIEELKNRRIKTIEIFQEP